MAEPNSPLVQDQKEIKDLNSMDVNEEMNKAKASLAKIRDVVFSRCQTFSKWTSRTEQRDYLSGFIPKPDKGWESVKMPDGDVLTFPELIQRALDKSTELGMYMSSKIKHDGKEFTIRLISSNAEEETQVKLTFAMEELFRLTLQPTNNSFTVLKAKEEKSDNFNIAGNAAGGISLEGL